MYKASSIMFTTLIRFYSCIDDNPYLQNKFCKMSIPDPDKITHKCRPLIT